MLVAGRFCWRRRAVAMVSDPENNSRIRYHCGSLCRLAGDDCHSSALPWHPGGRKHVKLNVRV